MKLILLASILLAGCATHSADDYTQVFIDANPGVTDIHQDTNFLQGYVDNYKVSGIVTDNQWKEVQRVARVTGGLDSAEAGQFADVGTTALGLSQGFAEANPLGIAILPMKYMVNEYAESSRYCTQIKPFISGAGWGAAAANVATIAGVTASAGLVAGIVAGTVAYNYLEGECEVWLGQPVTMAE